MTSQVLTYVFSKTASADLVSAVAGSKIEVLYLNVSSTADFTLKLQSGASSDITGAWQLIKGVPLDLKFNDENLTKGGGTPICSTVSGEKLNVVLAGTGTVAGIMKYRLTASATPAAID